VDKRISAINHRRNQGMIPMVTLSDFVTMLVVAAVLGGVGGLVGQLMATLQLTPVPTSWPALFTPPLGWIANPLVGAAAAVIALYFLAPITTTQTVQSDGSIVTTQTYDIIKLVALSLVVGTAGTTFIAAAQARILAAVNEQKVQTMEAVATSQVDIIGHAFEDEMTALVAQTAGMPADGGGVVSARAAAAQTGVQASVQAAKAAIHAAAKSRP
jgi:hypothetical protein